MSSQKGRNDLNINIHPAPAQMYCHACTYICLICERAGSAGLGTAASGSATGPKRDVNSTQNNKFWRVCDEDYEK
jgi:hypothetical protein